MLKIVTINFNKLSTLSDLCNFFASVEKFNIFFSCKAYFAPFASPTYNPPNHLLRLLQVENFDNF